MVQRKQTSKKEQSDAVQEGQKEKVKLVTMEREGKTADVHPDMVDEYRKGGWVKQ